MDPLEAMKLFSLREREEICDDAVKRKKVIGLRLLAGPKINLPPVSPHDRSKTKHKSIKYPDIWRKSLTCIFIVMRRVFLAYAERARPLH